MKNKKLKKIKKGPLSNSEKSEIEIYLTEHQDANSIATHLNRSENIVSNYINNISKEPIAEEQSAKSENEVEEQPSARTRTSELFARNEKYGVTVMTEQASQAGDEGRRERMKAATTHRYSKCTTTIRKSKK